MLGKRRRSPPTMKRTTSMTGINVDGSWPLDPPQRQNHVSDDDQLRIRSPNSDGGHKKKLCAAAATTWNDYRSSEMISPRYYMRGSGDPRRRLEIAPFLRTCGLCNRRLAIGRDIYMYRGDTAFCSEECREQQIKHDERKEKSLGKKATNIENHCNHDITYESSSNGETVASA